MFDCQVCCFSIIAIICKVHNICYDIVHTQVHRTIHRPSLLTEGTPLVMCLSMAILVIQQSLQCLLNSKELCLNFQLFQIHSMIHRDYTSLTELDQQIIHISMVIPVILHTLCIILSKAHQLNIHILTIMPQLCIIQLHLGIVVRTS